MNSNYTETKNRKYQRDLFAIAVCFLLVVFNAQADELPIETEEKVATSFGYPNHAESQTDKVVKKTDVPTTLAKLPATARLQSHGSGFDIFDADVTIYFDDDFDGHYYGLEVNFDADTEYFSADVYARLYLSYEGGPWELYYTTDVFTIYGDDSDDDYTVETELYNGYPTGYYDVLIELYDYQYDELVAILDDVDTAELDDIPLEDQQKDGGLVPVSVPLSHSHGGGGGSASVLIVLLLATTAWVRRNRKVRKTALNTI